MKIAIVELSVSHEECIYSQVSFLKEDKNEVSLIVHPNIKKQIAYTDLLSNIDIVDFDNLKGFKSLKKQLALAKQLNKFDKVILNTASSSKQLRNIACFLLFSKVECIGVLHNTKKLQKSFTQKVISFKIKKYFVLSDFLKNNAIVKNPKIKLESFYPIFFPDYQKDKLSKNENDIWFCIPGRVEFYRRDYFFLINQLDKKEISKNIKFIILGNINTKDGLLFRTEIEEGKLANHFVFFDKFIENDLYYKYIKASDYILPLLKKEDVSYLKYKISGTFNLAYGFKKIIFFNEFYSEVNDLSKNGISYDDSSFIQKLNTIDSLQLKDVYADKKWSFKYQQEKYMNFINR